MRYEKFVLRNITLFSVIVVLAACNSDTKTTNSEFDKTAAALMLPEEGENLSLMLELPKFEVKCEFENRMVCAGGTECKKIPNSSGTYTLIDIPKMTYKRCDRGGCSAHNIEAVGQPQGVRDISLGSIGTMVKYLPSNKFIDIATQGSFVYVSNGHCSPATSSD